MAFVLIMTYRWYDHNQSSDTAVTMNSAQFETYDAAVAAGDAWAQSVGNSGARFVVAPTCSRGDIYIHAPKARRPAQPNESIPNPPDDDGGDDDLPF